MTLEKLGYELWHTSSSFGLKNKVYYRRQKMFGNYYEVIKFNLKERTFELTNIQEVDMLLNEAIQNKLKELELLKWWNTILEKEKKMRTINKVVDNLRVWACQIQENLVSCTASYDTELNCKAPNVKEIIFKTNNVELALNKYIEMLKSGKLKRE